MLIIRHLAIMDESADVRWILTAVPQSYWQRLAGRPHTSWLTAMKNDLSYHNLSVEDATELALDRPLWRYWQQAQLRAKMEQADKTNDDDEYRSNDDPIQSRPKRGFFQCDTYNVSVKIYKKYHTTAVKICRNWTNISVAGVSQLRDAFVERINNVSNVLK